MDYTICSITGFLICCFLVVSCNTGSQTDAASQYAAAITPAALKEKLVVIASTDMEGRETATPGQKKAAAYIEACFKNIGLQPPNSNGYQTFFPVYRDSLETAELRINGQSLQMNKDFSLSASSITSSWSNVNEIVYASYGITDSIYNHFDGLDVKNKWVMVVDGMPGGKGKPSETDSVFNAITNSLKLFALRNKEIKGLLLIARTLPANDTVEWKSEIYVDQKRYDVPVIYITMAVAAGILQQPIDSFAKLENVKRDLYPVRFSFNIEKNSLVLNSSNVIGVLPGSDKKAEYVMITAHYDHLGKRGNQVFYGADDNGSGTCGLIQIATAFAQAKKAGHGPRRTLVFMAVSGEEEGLIGSEYYTDHHLFPMSKTSVDLNIDMVGRIDPDYKGDSLNYVYTIGEDQLSSELSSITDSINNKYLHIELDRHFNDPNDRNQFFSRSDHYSFMNNGVPSIFYFNGIHPDYHRSTDTVDKISFDLLAKRVKLVYYTAWAIANRDEMVKRDVDASLKDR